jgi:hypothetical protein
MVQLPQVHQFVDDDVVAHVVGQLDQAPVQRNGAVAGAGTPAALLIADDNAFDVGGMLMGQFPHAPRQFNAGRVAQMVFQRRAEIAGGIGQGRPLRAELQFPILPVAPKFQHDRPAAQEDFHAGPQHLRRRAPRFQNAPLFFQPAFSAGHKFARELSGALPRDGDHDRFVKVQTQDVIARARVAAVEDGHPVRMDFDDIRLARRLHGRDQSEKFSEYFHHTCFPYSRRSDKLKQQK